METMGPFTWQNASITSVWSLYSDALNKWRSSRHSDDTTAEKEKPLDVFDHWKSTRVNCCSFKRNDFKDSPHERKITNYKTHKTLHILWRKLAVCPGLEKKKNSMLILNKAAWFNASFMSVQVMSEVILYLGVVSIPKPCVKHLLFISRVSPSIEIR